MYFLALFPKTRIMWARLLNRNIKYNKEGRSLPDGYNPVSIN